ncbi:MAG: carboxypeptidase regulatory-like domain-containing protein, partial [Chloroflexi bacterium]|nr:carboxypeptidase regulatory-like domain-containing protein [Chloroflexota bacterium]
MVQRAHRWLVWLTALGFGLGVAFGCTALPRVQPPEATATVTPEPTPWPLGRIEWEVHVPGDTPTDAAVVLRVWDVFQGDEAVAYPLSRVGDGMYRLNLTWPVDQLVFYRFELQRADGTREIERTAWGAEVAYRAVLVAPRVHVREQVQRWLPGGAVDNSAQVRAGLGRLEGAVLDAQTGQPVPDILVLAGGHIARTDPQGRFRLEGLTPGAYNVVFYHPDARYQPWQQEALVAAAATTPIQVRLQPTRDVELTLEVQLPEGTVPGVPVRVVGTLRRLGLLDAPTRQGRWLDPMRAPQILPDAQGRYRITLRWPVGVPVRYAYTLGDGRVGRERDGQGSPRVRSVQIVETGVRTERVVRWAPEDGVAVWFEVDAGAMPPGEVVTLQFAQGDGWQPPVPMWPLASGRWGFLWYGERPKDGTLVYRYCRNAHCPWAAEAGEEGPRARQLVLNARPDQRVDDQVVSWLGYRPLTQPVAVVAPADMASRGTSWVQGIGLVPYPVAGDVEAYGEAGS